MRPANVITALADIGAGFAAGLALQGSWPGLQAFADPNLFLLLLATSGLYAGGVVLNDVFDADLDATERPERPIPSGQVSLRAATLFGILLLLLGVASAAGVGPVSATIAALVGGLAGSYDAFAKHHPWLGPVNMGLCRAGNLLLGMSAWPLLFEGGALMLFPLIFIAAITLVSRGEVRSQGTQPLWIGLALYLFLLAGLIGIQFWGHSENTRALLFVILFAAVVLPPLGKALREPLPRRIGLAVKWGVLGLIPMNAALAATFAGWPAGLLILFLMPVSMGLARLFAVT